ncbi:hypothetical protein [Nakamurella endophytica]|uniref:Uncharacterized protein n=1 Tax=Nakamurella endophytica TaxID=1748367 RepID=A0A917T594_9ACTN|nr:hypothetical protein [Nakamurella endophytica]GGM10245.1 hypothetical protein GCM10011594_32710 [Nakamurella endophytica]
MLVTSFDRPGDPGWLDLAYAGDPDDEGIAADLAAAETVDP